MTWRLRLLLFFGNLLVLAIVLPIGWFAWHHQEFALGALFGAALIAVSLRLHYGYWP